MIISERKHRHTKQREDIINHTVKETIRGAWVA